MRYVFLFIGAMAASVFWVQKSGDRHEVQRQLAQVPGYSIMPER
jgi:hypothetical protein